MRNIDFTQLRMQQDFNSCIMNIAGILVTSVRNDVRLFILIMLLAPLATWKHEGIWWRLGNGHPVV